MPAWSFIIVIAVAATLYIARRAGRAPARVPTGADRALADHVARAVGSATDEAPPWTRSADDDEKSRLRASEGGRVRLRGAVVDGELSKAGLVGILIEGRNPGEQAKAIRVLYRFYGLPEAIEAVAGASARSGSHVLLGQARRWFGRGRVARDLDAALSAVTIDDEPWLLGALLVTDQPGRRRVCDALASVGGRRSLDALKAMASGGEPMIRTAADALRRRLEAEQAGGLAMVRPSEAVGGLSAADGGQLTHAPLPPEVS